MANRITIRGSRGFLALLVFFSCLSNNSIGDVAVDNKIGVAIKNLVDAHDTIQNRMESLDNKGIEIEQEKKNLEIISKDLRRFFPGGRSNIDIESRGIFKGLKGLADEERKRFWKENLKKQTRSKRNRTTVVAVVAGVVLGTVSGLVLYHSLSKKRKEDNHGQSRFIDQLTDLFEKKSTIEF